MLHTIHFAFPTASEQRPQSAVCACVEKASHRGAARSLTSRNSTDGHNMMAEECALIVAAAEPFPILSASPAWCNVFGVQEADLKGCGFKAFDDSFRPLIPVSTHPARALQ